MARIKPPDTTDLYRELETLKKSVSAVIADIQRTDEAYYEILMREFELQHFDAIIAAQVEFEQLIHVPAA